MHNDAIAQRHHCIKMQPRLAAGAVLSAAPEVLGDRRPSCMKMQICKRPVGVIGPAGYGIRPCTRPSGPICNCIFPSGTPGADASSTGAGRRPADVYLHKQARCRRRFARRWAGPAPGSAAPSATGGNAATAGRSHSLPVEPDTECGSGPLQHACIIASSKGGGGRWRHAQPRLHGLAQLHLCASAARRRDVRHRRST